MDIMSMPYAMLYTYVIISHFHTSERIFKNIQKPVHINALNSNYSKTEIFSQIQMKGKKTPGEILDVKRGCKIEYS